MKSLHFLLVDLKLPNISTNAASYLGKCKFNSEAIQLTTEERSFAMAELLRLSERFGDRIGAAAGPLARKAICAQHAINVHGAAH